MATTYYVSKTGDNTTGLSLAHGKNTIADGIALMSGGDTLIIDDGTYLEMINNSVPSGSAGFPTIIKARNNILSTGILVANVNSVTLRPTSAAADTNVVFVNSRDYITFDGLDADAINLTGAGSVYAYRVENDGVSSHIIFQNGTARNASATSGFEAGVQLEGAGSHQVLNMDIYNIGNGSDPTLHHGIYIITPNNIIDGNRIHAVTGYALHQNSGAPNNNIYRRNYCYLNVNRGMILNVGDNTQVYNNIFANNSGTSGDHGGITIVTNGNLIFNNTIYGNQGYAIRVTGGSGNQARNNILYGNTSDTIFEDGGTITVSNNLLGTNPLFVNAPGGDFHILGGSPAVNAGVDLSGYFTTDIEGTTRPQ